MAWDKGSLMEHWRKNEQTVTATTMKEYTKRWLHSTTSPRGSCHCGPGRRLLLKHKSTELCGPERTENLPDCPAVQKLSPWPTPIITEHEILYGIQNPVWLVLGQLPVEINHVSANTAKQISVYKWFFTGKLARSFQFVCDTVRINYCCTMHSMPIDGSLPCSLYNC